jgi:hypothetical protein
VNSQNSTGKKWGRQLENGQMVQTGILLRMQRADKCMRLAIPQFQEVQQEIAYGAMLHAL